MTAAVIAPVPTGVFRFLAGMRMLANETLKGLQVMWSHKALIVPQFLLMVAIYWAIQFFLGGGRIVSGLVGLTLVGYWAYVVGYLALLRMAAGVLEERFAGTLEQSLLSPLRPWVLSMGRLGAATVEGALTGLIVTGFTALIFTVHMSFSGGALIPILLTLLDLGGFALLIGGLALVIGSIGSIVHVLQNVILLINGAFIPIYVFPNWLQVVAKIVPSTLGIDATRRMLFANETLGGIWSDGSLPLAIVHAGLMLVLGWIVFQGAIRRGLRDGRLGS